MKSYKPSMPRAALGLTAAAMAAITIGALVVVPAKFDSLGTDPYALAAARAATRASIEAAISPARIGVPGEADCEADIQPGATTLGVEESRGKDAKLSPHSHTNT
jgi:hypothetical protein